MSKGLTGAPNPRRGSDLYEFCSFRFDPDNRLLQRAGEPISLTPKALEVLLVLVQDGSQLTTKEELMSRVWGDSFVEDANLTVTISALRRQLGDAPEGQQYIETVPRSGYRFGVPVQFTSGDVPGAPRPVALIGRPDLKAVVETEDLPIPSIATTVERERPSSRAQGWLISAMAIVSLLLATAIYVTHRYQRHSDQAPRQVRRLAILPFQNLQENKASDFLGFSLADAIITKLGYVQALTVRPSYPIRKYRGQTGDIAKIASELNVDTLLTGTFLHEDDDLRIACQLVEVKTESILWKGAFDVKYDNLLTVQDRVAREVIRGLEITLSASEAQRLKLNEVVSPLAYSSISAVSMTIPWRLSYGCQNARTIDGIGTSLCAFMGESRQIVLGKCFLSVLGEPNNMARHKRPSNKHCDFSRMGLMLISTWPICSPIRVEWNRRCHCSGKCSDQFQ